MDKASSVNDTAYFAGGCFWHIEESFRCLKGVIDTKAGFMGGSLDNPSYEAVCTGETGHAETVKVMYNAEQLSFKKLLKHFFEIHDATSLNRQGPDIGTQYRSAIFFTNPQQEREARAFIEKMQNNGKYSSKIVTELTPASKFWQAEEYHQNYLAKNRMRACVI